MGLERRSLDREIRRYRRERDAYVHYARLLERILRMGARHVAPTAVVTARTKSIASFAEKFVRKAAQYPHPSMDLRDMAGARVVVATRGEADGIAAFIESSFDVVSAQRAVGDRLGVAEFGYFSYHFDVRLKPGRSIRKADIRRIGGRVAEIQVRTFLQHAWADILHDRLYKTSMRVPTTWRREAAALAAQIENADAMFARLARDVDALSQRYRGHMTRAALEEETSLLEAVLDATASAGGDAEVRQERRQVAVRLATIARNAGDWPKVIQRLAPFERSQDAEVLRELGNARCRQHRDDPHGRGFRRGLELLEKARAARPEDPIAIVMQARAHEDVVGGPGGAAASLYAQAFRAAAGDPYLLAGCLSHELPRWDRVSWSVLRPQLQAAVAECRRHVRLGLETPHAWFTMARFHLLLGQHVECLSAYARAALHVRGQDRTAVDSFEWERRFTARIREVAATAPDVGAILDSAAAFLDLAHRAPLKSAEGRSRPSAVLLCAESDREAAVPSGLRELLQRERSRPDALAARSRTTAAWLEHWKDLLERGVHPAQVRILAVGGAAVEGVALRIALSLGATVGVVEETGGAANDLLADEEWHDVDGLVRLPLDPMTVRAFLIRRHGTVSALGRRLAPRLHERYRRQELERLCTERPNLQAWAALAPPYRNSNVDQADDVAAQLSVIGFAIERVPRRRAAPEFRGFSAREVERLAEMEHGRYVAERLLAGWSFGPMRNDIEQKNPALVAWGRLSEDMREVDRRAVREIPQLLAAAGYRIVRASVRTPVTRAEPRERPASRRPSRGRPSRRTR